MSEPDDFEVDLNKKKIWQYGDVLDFGKFKGETIKHVLEREPSLLIWYHINVDWFELDEDILDIAERKVSRLRYTNRMQHYTDLRQDDGVDYDYGGDDEIPF